MKALSRKMCSVSVSEGSLTKQLRESSLQASVASLLAHKLPRAQHLGYKSVTYKMWTCISRHRRLSIAAKAAAGHAAVF